MALHEPQHDLEGIDCYNACYGGTAALLNVMNWSGRLGVAVCADIADNARATKFMNGAAAVAMAVSSSTGLVMRPARRTHVAHAWDFYKPVG